MGNKYQEALNDIAIDYQDLLKNWKTSLPKWEYEKTKNIVKENIDTMQELIKEHQKNLNHISLLEKTLTEADKALDKACYLAIENNNSGSYIKIHSGTREEYNLPLTLENYFNVKILKEYLLKEVRNNNVS